MLITTSIIVTWGRTESGSCIYPPHLLDKALSAQLPGNKFGPDLEDNNFEGSEKAVGGYSLLNSSMVLAAVDSLDVFRFRQDFANIQWKEPRYVQLFLKSGDEVAFSVETAASIRDGVARFPVL